jgi:tRNA threonylcarbamoyl adenosine modification protein YjeE
MSGRMMAERSNSLTLRVPNLQTTDEVAAALSQAVEDRAIVALIGPLGSGKTRFVQGVARALKINEVVNSPTFTMLNEYHSGRLPLYHLDLYRLAEAEAQSAAPILAIELTEILAGPGIVMIEWADVLSRPSLSAYDFLSPLDHLVISLSYNETVKETGPSAPLSKYKEGEGRKFVICPRGAGSRALIEKLRKKIARVVANS